MLNKLLKQAQNEQEINFEGKTAEETAELIKNMFKTCLKHARRTSFEGKYQKEKLIISFRVLTFFHSADKSFGRDRLHPHQFLDPFFE